MCSTMIPIWEMRCLLLTFSPAHPPLSSGIHSFCIYLPDGGFLGTSVTGKITQVLWVLCRYWVWSLVFCNLFLRHWWRIIFFSSVSKYLLTSYYWVFPVNDIETLPLRTHVWRGTQFPRVSPCMVDGLRAKTGSFYVCAIKRKPTVGV